MWQELMEREVHVRVSDLCSERGGIFLVDYLLSPHLVEINERFQINEVRILIMILS